MNLIKQIGYMEGFGQGKEEMNVIILQPQKIKKENKFLLFSI